MSTDLRYATSELGFRKANAGSDTHAQTDTSHCERLALVRTAKDGRASQLTSQAPSPTTFPARLP